MATGNINYDYDQVIDFILNTGADDLYKLSESIQTLQDEINDCEDKFHCKGEEGSNLVLNIYQGFSDIMGESAGTYSGSGLAGLSAYSGQLENTIYSEAMNDKNYVESFDGFDGLSLGVVSSPVISGADIGAEVPSTSKPKVKTEAEARKEAEEKDAQEQQTAKKAEMKETETDKQVHTPSSDKSGETSADKKNVTEAEARAESEKRQAEANAELAANNSNKTQADKKNVTEAEARAAEEQKQQAEKRKAEMKETETDKQVHAPSPGKSGTIKAEDIDYTRLSNSAKSAKNGNFISENNVSKEYFGDQSDGVLSYEKQSNGTYILYENGVPMAFTDKINVSVADTKSPTPSPVVPEVNTTTDVNLSDAEASAIMGDDMNENPFN